MTIRDIFRDNILLESVYALLVKVNNSVSHRKNIIVEEKNLADFVTNIDFQVEQTLVNGLKEIEDIPCLTEESNQYIEGSSYWVIDPVDGTTNLLHEYPSYCVSVAKVENGVTGYGFVYNLANKELFIGIRGQGAYLLNTRSARLKAIRVSDVFRLSDSLIGFGCPYDKTKTDKIFEISNKILKNCHDVKRNGPASLDICYVASGRIDAYYELDLKEWDYKAGKLILEEAGGRITDWNGNSIQKNTNNIVASNNKIHEQLLQYLGNMG
ncbi:MAG: inositol monophosphatase [Lachnospiraceae bacterium]|nr:inositol monophosphatase [Lachnospiraceae bacterium]